MPERIDDHPFAEVRAFIQTQLVETCVPSLAVAVARDGEIIWEEGFGWASREDRVPATPHTLYALASISKPLTATGLMTLVEKGLVDLERPVDEYLGDVELNARCGRGEEATVRRVANHSSGLPTHYQFFYEDEPYQPPAMDETIRRYGNLVTPPGERFCYANLGYGLLDYVIARVSGQSFSDFMRAEVFAPLGMTRASVGVEPGLEKYQAARYNPAGERLPLYDFDHPGASAVCCSAHDLVRFGMFHLKAHLADQKAILSDAGIDAMQVPTAEVGEDVGYGIGWRVLDRTYGGYRMVEHGGSMGGVRTQLYLVPSEKLAIVALCNTENDLPARARDQILAALLPAYGQALEESGKRKEQESAEPPAFAPVPELLGIWKGHVHTYARDLPFVLEFHPDGDIHARLDDQLKTLVNNARLADGHLSGRLAGRLGTEDTERMDYLLELDLRLRGDVLHSGYPV